MECLGCGAGTAVVGPLQELIAQPGYIFGILALGPMRWQQSTPQQRRHAKMDESVGSEIHSLNVFGKIAFGRGRFHPSIAAALSTDLACRSCCNCGPLRFTKRRFPALSRTVRCTMRSELAYGYGF